MARKLDDFAIRLISQHGQLIERHARSMDSEHKQAYLLELKDTERELWIEYKLKLPFGVAFETRY